jgi:hypothetical protein
LAARDVTQARRGACSQILVAVKKAGDLLFELG